MTIRKPFAVLPLPLSNVTTGNARTNRPASHLALPQYPGMRWQSDGNGNLWVRGQFDTARPVNFASLMGANAQAGTTIRVRLGMSQAQVDGVAAYDSGVVPFIDPFVTRADGLYHSHLEIPALQTAFWWRIDIAGHAGDFSASALIFGEEREPAHFYNRDREMGFADLGELEISRNGIVAETPGMLLRTLVFRLQWVSDDEYARVWAPMMAVKGKRQVTYWCFDPQADNNRQDHSFLGYMERELFKRGNDFPKDNQMDFQLRAFSFATEPVWPASVGAALPEPSLYLDFSTLDTAFVRAPGDAQLRPRAFSPFITFARASTAMRMGASGLLESVANNIPRLEHDPITRQPRGLLIEDQRTNLLTRSAQINDAAWLKNNATVVADAGVAPDGTTSADKLISDAGTTRSLARQFTVSTGQVLSVFAKAAEWSRLCLGVTNNGGLWGLVNFNLANGTIGANVSYGGSQVGSPTITALGNGWYRCSVVLTTIIGGEVACLIPFNQDGDPVNPVPALTGNGTSGILVWGAQLETGSFPSSYIPTEASQATRAADSAVISGASFSEWHRQGEGSLALDAICAKPTTDVEARVGLSLNDGTNNNNIFMFYTGPSGTYELRNGGVIQASGGSSYSANVTDKMALAYRSNDVAFARHGSLTSTDSSAAIPAVDRLAIGSAPGNLGFFGIIRQIRFWPTRLTNAQLQALTT